MTAPAEKPSLHSYLREYYGSSTQKLVREHERSLHKRARCSNHHIFSMKCRDEGVFPASFRIKPPVKTREGYRIAEQASRAFLSVRIHKTYRSKRDLSSKIRTLQSQLQCKLQADDYQKVIQLSYSAAESTHAKAKLNHTRKLDRLRDGRDKHREMRPQGMERWVINLTNQPLSKPQEDVLRLGLNFTPAPTKLPLVDTIAAVEEGARQLNEEDAEDLRGRV